jgi:hypothetical protein
MPLGPSEPTADRVALCPSKLFRHYGCPTLRERGHRRLAGRLVTRYIALVNRAVLAAAVLCLGLIGLLYGLAGTSEALNSIFVGTGLVLTSIGAMWLAVELFVWD